jgi:hypothetical protein
MATMDFMINPYKPVTDDTNGFLKQENSAKTRPSTKRPHNGHGVPLRQPGPNLDWVNELLLHESEDSFFGTKEAFFVFEELEASEPEKGGMFETDQGASSNQRFDFTELMTPAQVLNPNSQAWTPE